ncbi:MAG TPA: DsbA family protein [Acidimicrobiia bacterium]|nr:DsbA family protein [Acidimicrobiia bacterium]
MSRQFAVTFDYRCPFARNGHTSVVAGLRAGRDWDVTFLPFSLDQVHVEDGEPAVWERDPADWGTGVTALLWAIAVRDEFPDKFLDWHLAAFSARHDHGAKIAKEEVLAEIATSVGLDPAAIAAEVASGRPLKTLAQSHSDAVKNHAIFGVPTFVAGDQAVFVRLMDRDNPDAIDRVIDLLEWTDLNEFKHTSVPR